MPSLQVVQSVQVSFGEGWGYKSLSQLRADVLVDGNLVGTLESEWTDIATSSFQGFHKTRQTEVHLTGHAEWSIRTETPDPLPSKKLLFGRQIIPKRPEDDRRVLLMDSAKSAPLAVFRQKGSRLLMEATDGMLYKLIGGKWMWYWMPVAMTDAQDQLVMKARRNWYKYRRNDEFQLAGRVPLEIVMLTWHVLSRDYKSPPSEGGNGGD